MVAFQIIYRSELRAKAFLGTTSTSVLAQYGREDNIRLLARSLIEEYEANLAARAGSCHASGSQCPSSCGSYCRMGGRGCSWGVGTPDSCKTRFSSSKHYTELQPPTTTMKFSNILALVAVITTTSTSVR
ncbi:hypothetical protein CC2G_008182 [Coprinopsis cinerea AmutBmut pab1-1]|nr:hypothetical protein CC2G_008182 [Coprinopsis cinerea AmutBmut pab1-1]